MATSSYKIGALSSLMPSELDEKSSLHSLFNVEKRPEEVLTPVKAEAKIAPGFVVDEPTRPRRGTRGGVKKKMRADMRNKSGDELIVAKNPKLPKIEKDEEEDDDGDEEEEVKYSQPSRQFQVVNEERNKGKNFDEEKEARTVFVGNLPNEMTKHGLVKLFRPFGTIESARLRGAPRPDLKTTKKVAIITKSFNEKRSNILGYVRYTSVEEARKSLKLNGTNVGEHTLRVDMAMGDGGKTGFRNQSKAVFVGNLGFSVEEEAVRKHFERCGAIVDVRIVRDAKSGMGKGFCYVNFDKKDGVETAVSLMDGSQLEGRPLRVSRSSNRPKKTVKVVEKIKSKGAFGVTQGSVKKAKVMKVHKQQLRPTFEGRKVDDDDVATKKNKKKKKKKFDRGERRKKINAKLMSKK